jgi:hypothetical protein
MNPQPEPNQPDPNSPPDAPPSSPQPPPDSERERATDSAATHSGPVVSNATESEVTRFVSTIKNVEQQVGENVIQALQHAETVAVLTSVVAGPGGQQYIVSAALNQSLAAQVNALLQNASDEFVDEEMCVGFHCLVKPKPSTSTPPDKPDA